MSPPASECPGCRTDRYKDPTGHDNPGPFVGDARNSRAYRKGGDLRQKKILPANVRREDAPVTCVPGTRDFAQGGVKSGDARTAIVIANDASAADAGKTNGDSPRLILLIGGRPRFIFRFILVLFSAGEPDDRICVVHGDVVDIKTRETIHLGRSGYSVAICDVVADERETVSRAGPALVPAL